MNTASEQGPMVKDDSDDDRQWSDWWQGYWSDAPATAQPHDQPHRPRWRESAHEFDFGGEE